ncbi:Predicted ATPase [Actinacidiphila alni]|uniref:Predicted ATPase n=1 Tax=Actinacidiphila alni TaxID=380248 RepID=A0A1I2ALC7_9ACTN|nr:hypothetical protein [Actinacidiphila alni]SFE44835.1 Predicted ATPase [Actinacidiphila alni]
MWTSLGSPRSLPRSRSWGSRDLIGRKQESAALRGLLARNRLVSVTGAAGVGKSHLAARVVLPMPMGLWESLVQVRWHGPGAAEPGALLTELARTLSGGALGGEAMGMAGVLRRLAAAPTLLFLDDVDPVQPECVGIVQQVLMAVPTLRVLVTSRQALGLGDERVLRLPPLSTGGTGDGRAPAVDLFVDRVRTAVRDFPVDSADLDHATAICRAVEGVPLAIELAAEQTAHFTLSELAKRLEEHQGWLSSPYPVLRRHRSLREAIGATYVLCEPVLRIVWGRISILNGWFTEGTAVLMCGGEGVDPALIPGCLARLTAMGVLDCPGEPGGARRARYRLTRAAREFGAERLSQAGEFPVAAERRLVHCRSVATVAENLWSTGSQPQAVWLAEEELADLDSTMRYAVEHGHQVEAALETVVNLWFLWAVYGRAEEGRGYLLQLLPLCEPEHPLVARGLWLAAWLTAGSDPDGAAELLRSAWPAAVLAGDDAAVGRIAHVQGLLAMDDRDAEGAAGHFQEAASTVPPGSPGGPSPALSLAALALAQSGFAPAAAKRSARLACAEAASRGDAWAAVLARYAAALADHRLGRSGRAWRRAQRALATLHGEAYNPDIAIALRELITAIESGAPARPSVPPMPLPTPVRA